MVVGNTANRPLEMVASLSEEMSRLPAVATLDWCDRAAAMLAEIRAPSIACLSIVTLDQMGRMLDFEAAGVAASGDDQVQHESALTALRSRLERLGSIGWAPAEGVLGDTHCGTAGELAAGRMWRTGPLGRFWAGLEVADAILGTTPLGSSNGRVLLVKIALLGQFGAAQSEDVAILTTLLPVLARRAEIAIGRERSNPSRWLTSKEQMILEQLALGKSVKQIAKDLDRSPHTVHDHVKALHRKLNASSRGELIARALGHLNECVRVRDSRPRLQYTGEVEARPTESNASQTTINSI